MNEWIDVREKLPPDKTWVEAIFICPGTSFTWEQEWFFWRECWDKSSFDKKRVTHWRFITHPFFEPIANYSCILEIPVK